jgi:hypothetical protein
MSDPRETPGLSELEAALGALTPRPPALNRDAILYRAGRASVRGWQWATAVSTTTAVALAMTLVLRPSVDRGPGVVALPPAPRAVPPVVPEAEPSPSTDEPSPSPSAYFRLQEQLLSRGLDGLPPLAAGPGPSGPTSADDLFRGM